MSSLTEITIMTILSICSLVAIAAGVDFTQLKSDEVVHVSGYVKDAVVDHSQEPYESQS